MNWFRQTLQKYRVTFLTLLAINVFFMVDGTSTLYAHELKQHERALFTQSFARTFGLPSERFQDDRPTLEERFDDLSEAMEPRLAEAETRIEDLVEEFLDEIDTTSWWAAAPRQYAASPQEPATDGKSTARPRPEGPAKPIPVIDGSTAASVTSRSTQGPAPVVRVEKKARTVSGSASTLSTKVSAVASPSTARRVIPKAGIATEITALADSLDNSPARIFRFVHDTIDYDPKWGAGKSPLGTLQEGLGTSWEQAWLLMELLTAAGVDARVEWGEVEIPTDLLLQLAGVTDPFRAGDLVTTAGLPIVLVVAGSQVIHARMSHAWVKAHLDYIPRRGVTAGPGDTWLRMDPSLKRFETTAGTRLDEAVPYDLGAYLQGGTESSPRQVYDEAIQAHITDQNLGLTLEEVKPAKQIIEEAFPFVPGTLRAKILSVTGESTTVPESFQQRLDLQVREDGGATLLTWSGPWPSVYGQRLELAWPGATAADQATLDLYGGVFVAPPYEVDLTASLRLEGAELAAGGVIGSAEDVTLVATVTPPSGPANVVPFAMRAGEHAILNLDFGRQPQEVIDRYATEQANASDTAEIEAWGLARAAAVYLQAVSSDVDHLAALRGLRRVQIGNVALAVQRGAVSVAPDGTPLTFSAAPPAVDLGSMTLGLFPADGTVASSSAGVATLELIGSHASFIEGEALATALGGEHLTAVTALTRAVREGQALTRVDAANVDTALADADLGDDAEGSVQGGVGAGQIAWIHQTQLEHLSWDAAGYVLENPASGAGGYFVTYERLLEPLDATITFHAPLDLDEVTAPTDVVATIEGDDIESWTLSYKSAEGGDAVVIATGNGAVTNETLGQFDPTLLLNGMVDLVLTARNAAGQTASQKITVVVGGQMKIGHFTLSFVDLAVPVSGLDIEVVRTYDSRDKRQGDFGIGWSLDIRQGSYRNNRPPGDGWQLGTGFLPCDSVIESKSHLTTIRLSDQEIYRFALRLQNGVPSTGGGCFADTRFGFVDGPVPGATLEILGNTQVFWETGSDRVISVDTLDLFEPRQVRLTTRDGRIFDLDLAAGVTGVEDLNGNRLEIDADGIRHSTGREITFIRDAENRISTITDPLARAMTYSYNENGDLASFTDRAEAVTRFTYDSNHRVLDIENALGIKPIRNEYDSDGRLVRHIDAFGKVIELSHDLENRREVITNRLGASRSLEYDYRGNVIYEEDEVGGITRSSFDDDDNQLTETDPLNRTTTFTYSSTNDLVSQTNPLGLKTTYAYNSLGQLTTVSDPRGHVTTSVYDNSGNLLAATDALSQTTTYTYDGSGNLLTTTDALGQSSEFTYNNRGDLLTETDVLGNVSTFTYDENGNRVSESRSRTLPDGSEETLLTSFVLDGLDRVTQTTTADGSSTTTVYDDLGRVLSQTDPLARVTTMAYDLMGRPVLTTFPDATTQSRAYDAEGRIQSHSDRQGRVTTMVYDAAGQLLSTTYPDGGTNSQIYDLAGQLTSTTDALGNTTAYVYDASGRRTTVVNALGQSTVATYDANGNQISVTDARSHTTNFFYDDLDRLVTKTFADGSSTNIGYDALGRQVTETDPTGNVTTLGYDALGRLTSVTDALGQVTSYVYDEVGNQIRQTDANGHVTRFEYDTLGRQIARILPGGDRESMSYEVDGTLASHTDFLGQTSSFHYDINRRLVRRTSPGGSEYLFTHTASGQRETAIDSRGVTTYAYDDRDRLLEKVDPTGHRLTYTYDLHGNVTTLTAVVGASSATTSYVYDALNRPSAITDPGGQVNSPSYDANGNRSGLEHANGLNTAYSYDALNRLTRLETRDGGSNVLQSYEYTLAATGHRTRVVEANGVVRAYAYDDLYRLTQSHVTDSIGDLLSQRDFSYDPVGNRLSQTVIDGSGTTAVASSYDERDRLLTANATDYSWDANGDLVGRENDVLDWDLDQRLSSIALGDGTEVSTVYDVDGNRVRTDITSAGEPVASVDYLVDTRGPLSHVVAEIVGGAVETIYVRSNDELLSLWRPQVDEARWFLADGIGSVRALANSSGMVTDTYEFSVFGELIDRVGSDPQPYLFAGEAWDANSQFYYNRARWLDPKTGRFVSVDPFGGMTSDPISLHRYLYASLDPVNTTDPTGLISVSDVSGALAAIGNLASLILPHVIQFIARARLAAFAASTASVASIFVFARFGPFVLRLLQGTGMRGVRLIQGLYLRLPRVVTQAEAARAPNWPTHPGATLNRLFSGAARTFNTIQWHHIVGQQQANLTRFGAQSIHSILNLIPTPAARHALITTFYNSGRGLHVWLPQGFRTLNQWIATQPWEVQYRIGWQIWWQVMRTGRISWVPPTTLL